MVKSLKFMGLDYHYVLQDKLKRLAEGIEKLTENWKYKGMVDAGPWSIQLWPNGLE